MSYIGEGGYIELLQDVLNNGEERETRNGLVISSFSNMIRFNDIHKYFPLLTTKKMFFRGIVEELLWFLRGSTDAKELQEKNIHIWDLNSSRQYLDSIGLCNYDEGELGPIYGWQWRKYGKKYKNTKENDSEKYVDQLKYVIEELMKNNSRRIVLSGWNPVDLNEMALPPCHILYIFYKSNKGLSCQMTMRSSDLFLGLPFNIASTALLTCIIAKVMHMEVNSISLILCDAHIYKEHIEAVKTQIERELKDLPQLSIKKDAPEYDSSVDEKIKWIEELKYEDFTLENYTSHTSLKAPIK
jgi:thymidylate synthase